ncbi:YjbE family putative metal transport protein [Sphingomonas pruni]|uniref:YjbE family putative metal transport protein n=1 Tax=Sphingomonas pruni TaxID=40683 RepID=UPI000830BEBE|nr:YjbE family putative metal transport protein [Sphingomonas pruni]
MDIAALFSAQSLAVLGEVVVIDLALAGDNAVVVGSLAAGLPKEQQRKVIIAGTVAALVLRIGFALIATYMIHFIGVLAAGGLLLLWVAWKLWRELRHSASQDGKDGKKAKTFGGAVVAVALADVSMSLDNVLGVAGAARDHPAILIFGLIFSVALMGLAANFIARIIDRHRWIAYVGLVVILWVACSMIYDGLTDQRLGVLPALGVELKLPQLLKI